MRVAQLRWWWWTVVAALVIASGCSAAGGAEEDAARDAGGRALVHSELDQHVRKQNNVEVVLARSI